MGHEPKSPWARLVRTIEIFSQSIVTIKSLHPRKGGTNKSFTFDTVVHATDSCVTFPRFVCLFFCLSVSLFVCSSVVLCVFVAAGETMVDEALARVTADVLSIAEGDAVPVDRQQAPAAESDDEAILLFTSM